MNMIVITLFIMLMASASNSTPSPFLAPTNSTPSPFLAPANSSPSPFLAPTNSTPSPSLAPANSTPSPLDTTAGSFFSLPLPVGVRIINAVSDGVDLHLHCKSKETDFGPKLLPPYHFFNFEFITNVWGTTSYRCSFRWENEPTHWFHVYKWARDREEGITNMIWRADKKGPCRDGFCYQWDK